MEKWEVTTDRTWTVVHGLYMEKWKMVTRATEMAAKRGGYESVAALTAGKKTSRGQPTPAATGDVPRETYDRNTPWRLRPRTLN